MGRFYTADSGWTSGTTTAIDFLELTGPGDHAMLLHWIKVANRTDAGDAKSDQLEFAIKRAFGTYTSGSGGGTATINKWGESQAAHGLTLTEARNPTKAVAGSGTLNTIWSTAENNQAGWEWVPPPWVPPLPFAADETLIIGLENTPLEAIDLQCIALLEIVP